MDLPRRSERTTLEHGRVGRPPTTIQPSQDRNSVESPLTNDVFATPIHSPDVILQPKRKIQTRGSKITTINTSLPTTTKEKPSSTKRELRRLTKKPKPKQIKRTRSTTTKAAEPRRSIRKKLKINKILV